MRQCQYYTVYGTNFTNRLIAHKKGEVSFAKDKLPVQLVHLSHISNKQKAYVRSSISIIFLTTPLERTENAKFRLPLIRRS